MQQKSGSDPGVIPLVADSDGDGVMDGLEDLDNDGLSHRGEWLLNRDPNVPDTDRDGIRDGDEDSDADSLSDGLEVRLGTNPLAPDTDLDGWPDETEVLTGSNPLESNSKPDLFVKGRPGVILSLPSGVDPSDLPLNTVAGRPPV